MLTPKQVAEAFCVDPKTVSRWARDGKIKAVRTPGGHHRFRFSEVQALVDFDNQEEEVLPTEGAAGASQTGDARA